MAKAVFRPTELVALTDKVIIDSPTSYAELAHLAPVEEVAEDPDDVEEYKGPTADDLRREAELFMTHWEEEKVKMRTSAKAEADRIIQDAQKAAFTEVKTKSDEAFVIKQDAELEAEKIIQAAQAKAKEMENEMRQNLDAERKAALEEGHEEGKKEGYAEGKAEVERLIERTQTVLERAQDKRGDILSETEKQIVTLVLLIARKVIKVISENQRSIIIANVIEALRKIKSKGDVIIRVNLADLKLATEHKQEFIRLAENVRSIQIVEDTSVDPGGCVIETDFGEIDARIASQLTELENKILEVSPIKSLAVDTPQPVFKRPNLESEIASAKALLDAAEANEQDDGKDQGDEEIPQAANAALTASAAMAALATIAAKGRREGDKQIMEKIEEIGKRKNELIP